MIGALLTLMVSGFACCSTVFREQPPAGLEANEIEQIYSVAMNEAVSLPDQLALIAPGLTSENRQVREAALNGVFILAYRIRTKPPSSRPSIAPLLSVRAQVLLDLESPSQKIREAAMMAFFNIQIIAVYRIDEESCEIIERHLVTESSNSIRLELIKSVGLDGRGDAPACLRVIHQAFEEPTYWAVTYAGMGAARLKLDSELPTVAELLSSSNREFRLIAAKTLAQYGPHARGWQGALEVAALWETDKDVRDALRLAISAVSKK